MDCTIGNCKECKKLQKTCTMCNALLYNAISGPEIIVLEDHQSEETKATKAIEQTTEDQNIRWVKTLSRKLIKSASFFVGGVEVQRVVREEDLSPRSKEWRTLWKELSKPKQ